MHGKVGPWESIVKFLFAFDSPRQHAGGRVAEGGAAAGEVRFPRMSENIPPPIERTIRLAERYSVCMSASKPGPRDTGFIARASAWSLLHWGRACPYPETGGEADQDNRRDAVTLARLLRSRPAS